MRSQRQIPTVNKPEATLLSKLFDDDRGALRLELVYSRMAPS
ncbi:hypothetical protein VCRLGP7_200331 [Vibrio crassostreae]|nr:hypothetical protein VCRLGP7_200331 [Vibrio crassostreae]